jgi:hypothetical protein
MTNSPRTLQTDQKPKPVFSPPPQKPRPTIAEVKVALDSSRWIAAKRDLINLRIFPWLEIFGNDLSVDAIVYDVTNRLLAQDPTYDAYQIESLISSASSLLDRCLVYRRDMYDLEEKVIRKGFEYKLFIDQYDPQISIELAEHTETQRKLEQAGQQAAYKKFTGGTSPNALAQGFGALSSANAASSGEAAKAEQERKANVRLKWTALKNFQEALQDQHSTPGSPFFYEERFNRLRGFLEQDIKIAFQKLRCVQLAANKIFGLSTTLDPPFEYGYLDYMVMKLREIVQHIEQATIQEVDFEHVVSLTQARVKPDGSSVQLIDNPKWTGFFKNGLFSFTLRNEFPAAISRLRIKAIALSMVTDHPESPTTRERAAAAAVFPPPQEDIFHPGVPKSRSPALIEKIDRFSPASLTKFINIPGVANIDPREDRFGRGWQIQLSSNMLWPDAKAHGRSLTNILDIKLHLKLGAIMNNDPTAWTDLSV